MAQNPYQSPRSAGDSSRSRESERRRRFEISIVETSFGVCFVAMWFAFLIPAVNQARYDQRHAPILDGFSPFAVDNGWSVTQRLLFIPACGVSIGVGVCVLLLVVHPFLPQFVRQRIVWLPATGPLSSANRQHWIRHLLLFAFFLTLLFLSIIFFPR